MREQKIEQILLELKENTKCWDQRTASLPTLLQANGQLLSQLQGTGHDLDLGSQQKAELQQIIASYWELLKLAAAEKQKILAQLKRLDRQKAAKVGTYKQKITDGAMVEFVY